ncbi:MAG: LpxD N-terminal domain-containing protein, partial [Planctomyces sp.]
MTTATSQTIPTAPAAHAPQGLAPAREVTSAMLAERLGGRLVGPPDVVVTRADALADADERTLSFIRDAAFAKDWAASRAGVALVSEGLSVDAAPGRALVFVRDADLAMVEALNMLAPAARQCTPGIDPRAIIEPGAMIDPLASIGPFAVVRAGASVGEGSSIASGVVIDAGSRVGRFTTIHANVTIANASVVGDHCIIH